MTAYLPIHTPRLLLRDFVESDWPCVHAYARLPKVSEFMPWGPHKEEDSRQFVERCIMFQREAPRLHWDIAVALRQSGRIIGWCGLTVNPAGRSGSIGYTFGPDFWGQGYATEAAGALLDLGFGHLELHRITGTCDPKNVGSARVLEKCGMRREAHMIEERLVKANWRDSFLYAMLQSEWMARALKGAPQ